jgi:hypothetical protein
VQLIPKQRTDSDVGSGIPPAGLSNICSKLSYAASVTMNSTTLAPAAQTPGWPDLADVDLLRALVETERRRKRLDAAMHAAVAEAERRGLAADTGYRDTVELLTDLLRISAHEARRRIGYAAPQARSRSRKVWRALAAAS